MLERVYRAMGIPHPRLAALDSPSPPAERGLGGEVNLDAQLELQSNTPLDRDPVYPVRTMLIILLYYLLFAAIWFQPWYAIWVVALAALLDNTPMRRLVLLLSYLVTWQSFIYNYVTLRADGWAPLPWRDLLPIAITMGVTWSYIAIFWLSTWLRTAKQKPLLIAVGERLRAAREAAHLIPADIGDSLNLRTDDLIGYERGDRAIPLDRAQAIAAELNVPMSALLGDG